MTSNGCNNAGSPSGAEMIIKLRVSKNLTKMEKLPSMEEWIVHGSEIAARGRVLCCTKKMTFWTGSSTVLKSRVATLTKNGALIIYDDADKGLVIDMHQTKKIQTRTFSGRIKAKNLTYTKCSFKLKFTSGILYMIAVNEAISKWWQALHKAVERDLAPESSTHSKGDDRKLEAETTEVTTESSSTVQGITESCLKSETASRRQHKRDIIYRPDSDEKSHKKKHVTISGEAPVVIFMSPIDSTATSSLPERVSATNITSAGTTTCCSTKSVRSPLSDNSSSQQTTVIEKLPPSAPRPFSRSPLPSFRVELIDLGQHSIKKRYVSTASLTLMVT